MKRSPKETREKHESFADELLADLAGLPDPPWAADNFSWPLPGQEDKDAFLVPMADALDQAGRWVEADESGPRWKTMLRRLADHFTYRCRLPEHGAVVANLEALVGNDGHLPVVCSGLGGALHDLAAGMRYFIEKKQPVPVRTWEAPTAWKEEIRQAAHALGEEVDRSAGYCRAWSHQDPGHPCHAGDSAGELWSRPWARRGDFGIATNCRVQIDDSDLQEHKLREYIKAHRPQAEPALEEIFGAIARHTQRVNEALPARSLVDLGERLLPPFITWSQELRKLSVDWQIRICLEPAQGASLQSMESIPFLSQNIAAIPPWRQELDHTSGPLRAEALMQSQAQPTVEAQPVVETPLATIKPTHEEESARGDPKPMDELLRIAQIKGLDPKRSAIGVLLAILHSEPRVGKTAFAWAGKKKGKVRGDTKRNLEVLEGRGLARKNMATPPLWCLGEAAFPGNGDTHGDTHGDTKLP